MTHRSILVAAFFIAGCVEDPVPPEPPPCDELEWFPDADADGFGDSTAAAVLECEAPDGHVDNADDCDDSRDHVHPDGVEVCDDANLDEDCSGAADDDDVDAVGKVEAWPDVDGDGFGDVAVEPVLYCDLPEGFTAVGGDCDDTVAEVNPDAEEVCDDLDVDEDCSGAADNDDPDAVGKVEAWPDTDGDGFGDPDAASAFYCDVPVDWAEDATDCDDTASGVNPAATEVCDPNDVDEDCSGAADDADPNVTGQVNTWADVDADGYGDDSVAAVPYCDIPPGRTSVPGDCDDAVAAVNPGASEVCDPNDVDEDCSGAADDADPAAQGKIDHWPDLDADGFGDVTVAPIAYCDPPADVVPVDGDCDDTLVEAYPGAAPAEDPAACMIDTDGDGWGDPFPAGGATAGSDCQPFDASVHPGAADPVDGLDQDCNVVDGPPFVTEDFDTGSYDPSLWAVVSGDWVMDSLYSASGSYSLSLGGGTSYAETVGFDTSVCAGGVHWSFQGKRGPEAPDSTDPVYIEWWDGAAWRLLETWTGDGLTDPGFTLHGGPIVGLDALHPTFALRFDYPVGSGVGFDHYYIDDLTIGCLGADADGDGRPHGLDCDDADPDHWSDCFTCVDADGDGYGASCDLGDDCDDADFAVHPGASDPFDGSDTSCDGLDGTWIHDDFDAGAINGAMWKTVDGSATIETTWVANGAASLDIAGPTTVESTVVDTTACNGVFWHYAGLKGGEGDPDLGEFLTLEYFDGSAWVPVDSIEGGSTGGGLGWDTWSARWGTVDADAAQHPYFQVRFRSTANLTSEHYYVDDVYVACADYDTDGDGLPAPLDCDDTDANHWFDCGLCVDADLDDRGTDCDLGPDCDDADPTTYPGAPDPLDGVDTSCDGFDGEYVTDGFEGGAHSPYVWASLTGNVSLETTWVGSGNASYDFAGQGTLESVAIDTSTCSGVVWSYLVMKGGDGDPETIDQLHLEYYTGSTWVELDAVQGGAPFDEWMRRNGTISDPSALHDGFRVRFRGNSDSTADHFYVDDVAVTCVENDGDGDGLPAAFDCDDNDDWHWSDCGLCVDADLDGRGTDCDLGGDCDEADPSVYVGAPDPIDGVDTSCDGLDGQFIADDFEAGQPSAYTWTQVRGSVSIESTWVAQGQHSLEIAHDDGYLESAPLDTSACNGVFWSYAGMYGGEDDPPDTTDHLYLEAFDGNDWVVLDDYAGGTDIDNWLVRYGIVQDASLLHAGFKVRLRGVASADWERWYVDDLLVGCTDADNDGDGLPAPLDCDDTSANHWFDCGSCVDLDNDGYGYACDLGPDCDDTDGTVFPGATDDLVDGLDQNCDLVDGPVAGDDFEAGAPDLAFWGSITGDAGVVPNDSAGDGTYALKLGGGTSYAETVNLDTTACPMVSWSFMGRRGPEQPDNNESVFIEWWDGSTWQPLETWTGTGSNDPDYSRHGGVIADPAALRADFKLRFDYPSASGVGFDNFFIDDVAIGCSGADNDADGFPHGLDCDDSDANHWSDCGACGDLDGDHRGVDCDLGGDCDESDPTVHVGSTDNATDGVDQDCDGIDGAPVVSDDFETGGPDLAVWTTISGNVAGTTAYVGNGSTSLDLWHNTGLLESFPADTSSCPAIAWSYLRMNGGAGSSDATDYLHLEWWDGASWLPLDSFEGGSAVPWHQRSGILNHPGAFHPGFAIRVRIDSDLSSDHFYVDDLVVGCSPPDADGDGVPVNLDCDDTDAWHWNDCGVCVDADLDGYGQVCDLGPDCDDAVAVVNPGAPDPLDGFDDDCDDLDEAVWIEDLETGGDGFVSMTADAIIEVGDPLCGVGTARPCGARLHLDGTATAETVPFDVSHCTTVGWSAYGFRGPDLPENGDDLYLEWDDGTGVWRQAHIWGSGAVDADWVYQSGTISDPASVSPNFRMRFRTDGQIGDDYTLDNIRVGCFD